MVRLPQCPGENNGAHARHGSPTGAPHGLKRASSHEQRVELLQKSAEVDGRIRDDPIRFALWTGDVAIETRHDSIANAPHCTSSFRRLVRITTKLTRSGHNLQRRCAARNKAAVGCSDLLGGDSLL